MGDRSVTPSPKKNVALDAGSPVGVAVPLVLEQLLEVQVQKVDAVRIALDAFDGHEVAVADELITRRCGCSATRQLPET